MHQNARSLFIPPLVSKVMTLQASGITVNRDRAHQTELQIYNYSKVGCMVHILSKLGALMT